MANVYFSNFKSNAETKEDVVLDIENYPTNIPEEIMCKILNLLEATHQITSRKCRYSFLGNPESVTDVYDEFEYEGRRFVRVESKYNADFKNSNGVVLRKGESYWIEVRPIRELLANNKSR